MRHKGVRRRANGQPYGRDWYSSFLSVQVPFRRYILVSVVCRKSSGFVRFTRIMTEGRDAPGEMVDEAEEPVRRSKGVVREDRRQSGPGGPLPASGEGQVITRDCVD